MIQQYPVHDNDGKLQLHTVHQRDDLTKCMNRGDRKLHAVSDQAVQLYFTIRDIIRMIGQQDGINSADIQR